MDVQVGSKQGILVKRLGEAPQAEFVIGLLATVRRIDHAYNTLLARHGLSDGRFAALLAISVNPGCTMARLAEQIEIRAASATGLIDGLERLGLISRTQVSGDRRAQALSTTAAGEELIAKLVPEVGRWLTELAEHTGIEDRSATWRVLGQLQSAL
jgi:DNA-binding MarR family transcriptional regulator